MNPQRPQYRCAIYTRKSHEEGLDQEFNSLDAQRESGQTFILSQKHEGWVALADQYDDGGFTGANTERPALRRLMSDIEAGKIDVVVVYKIDRLSRSLTDFVGLLQTFERHNVAFVSVTQQFNTANPMGRLMLNILICFAQFERENIAERIRDKMAASRRKGKWVGGRPPLGYDIDHKAKKLIVNRGEAEVVRRIFQRFTQGKSGGIVFRELNAAGITTKDWTTKSGLHHRGGPWNLGNIYQLLNNFTYRGLCEYHGTNYPGEHEAIVSQELWDSVHEILGKNRHTKGNSERRKVPGFLKGLARCGQCGYAMTMSWVRAKNGVLHRYYKCLGSMKHGADTCTVSPLPAGEIEAAVIGHIRRFMKAPSIIQAISLYAQDEAQKEGHPVDHLAVLETMENLDEVWEELYPSEQQRVAEMLIESLVVNGSECTLTLRADALQFIIQELGAELGNKPIEKVVKLPITTYRRCGRRHTIIAPSTDVPEAIEPETECKDPVALALARAYRWLEEIEGPQHKTIAEIAEREKVDSAYVRRHIRLTTLSPQIVERLLTQKYDNVVLSRIMKGELPELWSQQMTG